MRAARPRPDVLAIALYLAVGIPIQVLAMVDGSIAHLNYGHGWGSIVTFLVGAPCAAYLLLRGRPRARSAVYILLAFDIVRSIRLGHLLPLSIDVAILLYLQTKSMRALYPSMVTRTRSWHRALSREP